MDGYDRCKNGLGLLLILIYAVSAAPTCREDQKLRRDENGLVICCYTALCNKSQIFEFCRQDQGHDICVNCPPNSYTNDEINTAQWDEETDFCVLKPPCNSDELISVGNGCECNLAEGYWGVDSRNCQLDRYNCKQAGQQLRQKDGACINCDEDKFKPEDGTYGICQNKTKCKAGEEEVDQGSTKRDRRCRAIQIVTTSTLAPPTVTTNTEPPNEENENDDEVSILYWLLPLCSIISIMLIIMTICLCRKYRIYTQIPESFGHLCSQHPDTGNKTQIQELQTINGISQNRQNRHKRSDCNLNGSVNTEKQPFLDPVTNGDAIGTNDTDTSQTILKFVYDSDDIPVYPSFGKSIFDNDKNLSLEQNEGSLIVPMSAASNSKTPVVKTSPGNANNMEGNSVFDTARTGSTGNFPNSDLFHSLDTTVGEDSKSKSASSVTRNTEAPTNKTQTMATATPNHREISKSKAASSVIGNAKAPTNETRLIATGNTEPPAIDARPIAAVKPFTRSETSTSSRSQETTAPDNHDQRFPASPTTDGGVDIQTAVNEQNSKFVPNAPYPFVHPSHVNMPPEEPSESLDDYVAVGGSSRNDDSIVSETGSESTHVNMDDGNIYLPPEETSESLDDYVTVGGGSRNVIETGSESQFSVDQITSAGENGSGLRTAHGNPLAPPESTSTTSSNEPSLPLVESENLDSITESEGSELASKETTL